MEGLPPLYGDFFSWAQTHLEQGQDGHGTQQKYTPYKKLKAFWDDNSDRLHSLLEPYENDIQIDQVRDRFAIILSILLCISKVGDLKVKYILQFVNKNIDDYNLPILITNHLPPDPFFDQVDGRETWAQFNELQWQFCSVTFSAEAIRHKKELDPRCIWPVKVLGPIAQRKSTTLKKVEFHESSGLGGKTIVTKEYIEDELKHAFKDEVSVYTTIGNRSSSGSRDFFLHCYGSFIQGNKGVLLLEYADEGSLLDFWGRNNTPNASGEYHHLLDNFSHLITGLGVLHKGRGDKNRVVHQDIKPANIFIFTEQPDSERSDSSDPATTNKPYRYRFKHGDFSLSSVRPVDTTSATDGPDNQSTKMYSAPELYQHDPRLSWQNPGVTLSVDTWSLGCVIFECVVWMCGGERGRDLFFRMRRDEVRRISSFCNQGYEGAFHNGATPLKALRKMRDLVREWLDGGHPILLDVMDFILDNMLVADDQARLLAGMLGPRFTTLLDRNTVKCNPSHSPIQPTDWGSTLLPGNGHGRPSSIDKGTLPPHGWTSSPGSTHFNPGSIQVPLYPQVHRPTTCSPHPDENSCGTGRSNGNQPPRTPRPKSPVSLGNRSTPHICLQGNGNDTDRKSTEINEEKAKLTNGTVDLGASPPTSPNPPEGTIHRHSVFRPPQAHQNSNYPDVGVREALIWIQRPKSHSSCKLRGMDEAPMGLLANREQCFLVDNSKSMGDHWDDVERTFRAVSSVVKNRVPDAIDLRFTSDPTEAKRYKRHEKFTRCFDKYQPTWKRRATPMGSLLGGYLRDIVDNKLADQTTKSLLPFKSRKGDRNGGINVYILTDGIWEAKAAGSEAMENEAGGVDEAIKSIVMYLQEKNLTNTFLAVQFIRFGNNAEGIRRLAFLDDHLKTAMPGGWDIVDTRYHEASVWSMIFGALSKFEDGVPDKVIAVPSDNVH